MCLKVNSCFSFINKAESINFQCNRYLICSLLHNPLIFSIQVFFFYTNMVGLTLSNVNILKALDENRLHMLDYHDIYLPFIDRIRLLISWPPFGQSQISSSIHIFTNGYICTTVRLFLMPPADTLKLNSEKSFS